MDTENKNVSITFDLLNSILEAEFSITTTRLLIGMIFLQDRHELWRTDDLYMQDTTRASMWCFGAELRHLVGPSKANKAAPLLNLIAEVSGSGLFDAIHMSNRNHRIHWCFSSAVHQLMALRWSDDFALIDIRHAAACRSATTLNLYCRIRNLRNHRIPEFEIPLSKRWCDYRREFFQSLQQAVELAGTTAFVGLEWVRRGNGQQRLLIRLRHEGTTWFPDKLRSWSLNSRVFRVSHYEVAEIDKRDFREYAIDGENPTDVEANLRKNLPAASR
ncbi:MULTISPECIES: hypothetical protein [unclassified Sulfitobacter]|jgi:hypothetical protein|uniref:hypothetical protein n=1 Tax=unclassified Sulfitobacter TaxID=196795 RepID=UPI000AD5FB77|nr:MULTISPECIES: hypothetical protein [unclassified Sulfitobacter]